MKDILIKAENVSKKFCRDLKTSLLYGVLDLGSELLGKSSSKEKQLRAKEFWAVNRVNFTVKRGECLGLIGRNGAGKSTLLKMLNGLIKPDNGRIEMRGRVGALIELGAGFNPVLTGRENVYVNASVLGITKKQTDKIFDQIVEFAELEKFIDTPVQYYSSGMKVRLGFAVASQLKPDILLIDEVLAVGDAGFRIKCYNEMYKLLENTAIIFVSHSMAQVAKICNSAVLMKDSKVYKYSNNVSEVINEYYNLFDVGEKQMEGFGETKANKMAITQKTKNNIQQLDLLSTESENILNVANWDGISFKISGLIEDNVKEYMLLFTIEDIEQKVVCQYTAGPYFNLSLDAEIPIRFDELNSGVFSLSVHILETKNQVRSGILLGIRNCLRILISKEKFLGPAPVFIKLNEKR